MVEKTPDIKKEDKDSEKSSKKLGFSSSRLELKKTIGGGTVRQSFSHGRTKSVSVEVGQIIGEGTECCVLEAMKMQHEIKANIDGLTSEIRVKENSQVSTGDLLVKISFKP